MTGEGKKKGSTKQLYGVIGKSNNKSSIATKTLVQSKQSKLLRSDNELSDYSDSQ